jgi:hypothetical protein
MNGKLHAYILVILFIFGSAPAGFADSGDGLLAYNDDNKSKTTASATSQEDKKVRFSFYPNPVKDQLTVEFSERGNHKVEIYNMLGNKIGDYVVQNNNHIEISLIDLPKGMYFLTYKPENGRIVTKTFSKE